MKNLILQSTITCPHCNHSKQETMPENACQFFYECEKCGRILKPKWGDCCVFCSYGDVKCPPVQKDGKSCCGWKMKQVFFRQHYNLPISRPWNWPTIKYLPSLPTLALPKEPNRWRTPSAGTPWRATAGPSGGLWVIRLIRIVSRLIFRGLRSSVPALFGGNLVNIVLACCYFFQKTMVHFGL